MTKNHGKDEMATVVAIGQDPNQESERQVQVSLVGLEDEGAVTNR